MTNTYSTFTKQTNYSFSIELDIFKNKGVVLFPEESYELLKRGNFIKPSNNLIRTPKTKFNFKQTSSRKLGSTCYSFKQLSEDQQTWRKIAQNHQKYFISDHFETMFNHQTQQNEVVGFQTLIKQEIQKLLMQKQDPNFPNLSHKYFKKQKEKKEKIMKKHFNNNQWDESITRDENEIIIPVKISTNKQRIQYIHLLENPKEEMIDKARKIRELIKKNKKSMQERIRKRNQKEKEIMEFKSEKYLFAQNERYSNQNNHYWYAISGLFIALGLTIHFILLSIKVECKTDTKVTLLSIPLLLPLFGLMILFIFEFFTQRKEFERLISYSGKRSESNPRIVISLIVLVWIQILLIGLRVDGFIDWSWIAVLVPSLIMCIPLYLASVFLHYYRNPILSFVSHCFLFASVCWALFVIFLSLRIEGTTNWHYFVVFIPLILLNFVSFWSLSLKNRQITYASFVISGILLAQEILFIIFSEIKTHFIVSFSLIYLLIIIGDYLMFIEIVRMFK
ncbi:fam11a b protein [Anaeramoeba ignava]|uniref:Fam11a b protein n=1 Tax=Anaeramoeba ignava TaxID=1746090 RepID=A0A9Q0LJH8_ANAIG|nr:fam11a b protein [Anaeramoeba ignava]